jgi:nucleoside-diphosphate-sugar epimerase
MKVLKLVNFSKKILSSKSKIFKEKQKYYESNHLSLNSSKTLKKLKWKTLLRAKEAIQMTLEWYSFYYKNRKLNKDKIIKFSINQIKEYNKITLKRKI